MKKEEMMGQHDVVTAGASEFKDARVGFPENQPMSVIVLGQDTDYLAPGRTTPTQMVLIGINPEENPNAESENWRSVRVSQSGLANAIGLISKNEWKTAKDNGTIYRVKAHRDPAQPGQTRGTMRFERV